MSKAYLCELFAGKCLLFTDLGYSKITILMKKQGILFVLLALFIVGLSTSCTRRSCNGGWYNNRNVQVTPNDQVTPAMSILEIDWRTAVTEE